MPSTQKRAFGVAPGTNTKTNSNCMSTLGSDVIYTNVAVTDDGEVWWEGKTKETPANLTNWKREPHTGAERAAHANARFTVSCKTMPVHRSTMGKPPKVYQFLPLSLAVVVQILCLWYQSI